MFKRGFFILKETRNAI